MASALKVIFAGSGAFGGATLRSIVEAGHEIVHVFTQPDRPAGRGKKLSATPIAQLATELHLPVVATADVNTQPLPPADVMVVIAFGQKISDSVVHHPRLASVNLHASRLPKYRGAAPINWAILLGERTTGNSIIRLANKMDAGAVLAQSELIIGETETAGELHDRLATDGAPLMLSVLSDLQSGQAREQEQDHAAATVAPKLSRATATIDWGQPARAVARRINGLSPWPGCRVQLLDASQCVARLTLLRARPAAGGEASGPGAITGSGVIGVAGSEAIEVLDVQPEGKRPMLLADYRRGHRWVAGMRVESIG